MGGWVVEFRRKAVYVLGVIAGMGMLAMGISEMIAVNWRCIPWLAVGYGFSGMTMLLGAIAYLTGGVRGKS